MPKDKREAILHLTDKIERLNWDVETAWSVAGQLEVWLENASFVYQSMDPALSTMGTTSYEVTDVDVDLDLDGFDVWPNSL